MNKKFVVWLTLCLIWGSTWLFIKIGLRDLPPISFAALRFGLAAIILWGIAWYRKAQPPKNRRDWITLFWSAMLGFSINYSLIFWGEAYISSGLAAVLQSMIPAFGLIMAHWFLPAEKITMRKFLGVAVGIGGVALIFSDQFQLHNKMALAGSAALLGSAFFVSASNILIKSRGVHLDPVVTSATQMSMGAIPMFLVGFLWEGNPTNFQWSRDSFLALVYLAVFGSVAAFTLYYWLLKHWDVTKAGMISLVTPVIAVALGMLTLHEQLTWQIAVGTILIIGGITTIMGEEIMPQRKALS